jgi:hypothetical protein
MDSTKPDQALSLRNSALRPRFLLFIALSIILLLATAIVANKFEKIHSVFTSTNYLGPVTQNLHDTGRMALMRSGTPYIGTVPFYAARMPFPIYLLLALYDLFGDNFFLVRITKTALLFLPILLIVWMALSASAPHKRNWALCLMLLPLFIPGFLLLATGLQFEEAYLYSFLACALAMFFYFRSKLMPNWLAVLLFAISVDLTYLSKSSMRAVCFALVAAMSLQVRSTSLRALVVALTMIAPLGWGTYTYQATGRFSISSSLDGFNLHLGNFPGFLAVYPPADNGYMDQFHPLITPKVPLFHTEWEDNDYHAKLGVAFLQNRQAVIKGIFIKAYYYFLSLRDIGSYHQDDVYSRMDVVNMLLLRLLMLSSIAFAVWNIIKRRCVYGSVVYLLFVAGTAAPFIVGYAYTRHILPLIFPSAVALAYFLTLEHLPWLKTSSE